MNGGHSTYDRLPSELLDLVAIYRWRYTGTASDPILWEDLTDKTNNTQNWVTVKSKTIPEPICLSELCIQYCIKTNDPLYTCYFRLMVGEVEYISDSTTDTTYDCTATTPTELFAQNQLLEFQIKTNNPSGIAYLGNIKIRGIKTYQWVDIELPDWS